MTPKRIREFAHKMVYDYETEVVAKQLTALIAEVRREVKLQTLEEAAKVCEMEYRKWDGSPTNLGAQYATAIRQLAEREGER
jgi:hypothetical protein